MFTILTALRGDHALTSRLLGSIQASEMQPKILAAVNNDEDEALVKEFGGTPVPVTLYGGKDEAERVNHVALIYDQLIRGADTDLVVLLDDDILPPYKGFQRLHAAMEKATPLVAGIGTVYPYSQNPEQAVLFWKPFEHGGAPMSSIPANGLHEVWGGCTGFSIWRKRVLMKTIPWKTRLTEGYVPGWDRHLAIKLDKMGLKMLCETSIRCRHDTLPR